MSCFRIHAVANRGCMLSYVSGKADTGVLASGDTTSLLPLPTHEIDIPTAGSLRTSCPPRKAKRVEVLQHTGRISQLSFFPGLRPRTNTSFENLIYNNASCSHNGRPSQTRPQASCDAAILLILRRGRISNTKNVAFSHRNISAKHDLRHH